MTLLQPDDSVLDLFRALDGFHRAYWRSSHEPLASRAVSKLRQPLVEVVGLAVPGQMSLRPNFRGPGGECARRDAFRS